MLAKVGTGCAVGCRHCGRARLRFEGYTTIAAAATGVRIRARAARGFSSKHDWLADLLDRFAKYSVNSFAAGAMRRRRRRRGGFRRRTARIRRFPSRSWGVDVEQTDKDGNLAGLKVMVIDDSKTIRR